MITDVIRLTCKRAVPIDRVCEKLALSQKGLRALVKQGKEEGYSVSIVDGHVSSKVAIGATKDIVIGSVIPGRYRVAIATDLHFGSRHCDEQALNRFLVQAKGKGATTVVCTGDVLDGNKPILLPDQDYIGFDHQTKRAVDCVKKVPGLRWVAIDGNHDGYFSASGGFVSGSILQDRMREAGVDWTFAGVCLGRAIIHGAKWHLWHPHGGASTRNAVRRVLNERAEALSEACDVLAMGHFHKYVGLPIYPERVFGVAGGTFQRKASEFANRICRSWDIGGAIMSYHVDAKGRVTEVSSDFLQASG